MWLELTIQSTRETRCFNTDHWAEVLPGYSTNPGSVIETTGGMTIRVVQSYEYIVRRLTGSGPTHREEPTYAVTPIHSDGPASV